METTSSACKFLAKWRETEANRSEIYKLARSTILSKLSWVGWINARTRSQTHLVRSFALVLVLALDSFVRFVLISIIPPPIIIGESTKKKKIHNESLARSPTNAVHSLRPDGVSGGRRCVVCVCWRSPDPDAVELFISSRSVDRRSRPDQPGPARLGL